MELNLAGKVAIVTGGSAGIGLACARALYSEGVSVVIVGRDPARLAGAEASLRDLTPGKGEPQILALQADTSKAEDTERVVAETLTRFGRVDILVNNAGSAPAGSFLTLPDQAFLDTWNTKLLGYIRFVRAVAPHMIAQKSGAIVNIVGGASRTPSATFLTGSTANAALINFTRGISKELAPHNVRINAISPGSTATERAERLAAQNAQARGISVVEIKAENARNIPLGHMVDPDEIAAMTLLLVSERSRSITGIEILIDGGAAPSI
jgi:3-oxoacyl-[acyl-carrier protein] reductase/bacilysin biosynthesis oxidoreductase BacG